jgi:hypothetical protein
MSEHSYVDFRSLYEHKYIGAWNLINATGKRLEARVVIERVNGEIITGEGGKKERKPVVYFRGKKLPMILSKRNGKAIESIHGSNINEWIGKEITLWVERRMAFGKMTDVLSVRGKGGRSQALRERFERETAEPQQEEFEGAQEAAEEPE